MPNNYVTIGKKEIRKDALDKVTGNAEYTADIHLDNVLWGSIFRSTRHAAKIKNLDVTGAVSMPGVVRVITAKDIPGEKSFGAIISDQVTLILDEVRFYGEPIAIVVADHKTHADEALKKIQVIYEDLPPIFDPQTALDANAREIHPGGNLLTRYDVEDGDLKKGFDSADIVLEETFSVPRISPGYMEPENSLARWNEDGSVTVWVNSQQPFHDQEKIASVLGLSNDKVQVIGAVIGGAFGGKEDPAISILTALSSYLTKRNVRICNDRKDSFLGHPKRHPAKLTLKLGASNSGVLTALEAKIYVDTGAFASYGPAVAGLLTETVGGAYHIPNMKVETNVVYTNSPLSGAMRGFGVPQSNFAIESMMDILAGKLQIDPLEIRRRNILKQGNAVYTRVVVNESANSLPSILQKIEEYRGKYSEIQAKPGMVSGVGYACAAQTMGLGAKVPDSSSHQLTWQQDGTVLLHLGAPDLGQGLATIAEQVIAEKLGIPFIDVVTAPLDTKTTPDGNVTCASRMTFMVGNAVSQASDMLVDQLLDNASKLLRIPKSELSYDHGFVIDQKNQRIPVTDVLARFAESDVTLQATGTASFPYPIENTPQHLPIGMPHVMFVFAGQIARVEVDPELGSVEVTHMAAIHDVGQVINRLGVEGQIEGGVAMGIGYALFENMQLKSNGEWVSSFTEYLLPTTRDMPYQLDIDILEIPEKSGPFGAKGLAEICLVPTGAAIANAVCNATGKRITHLPISPEDLL